jgi:hypothetical protein
MWPNSTPLVCLLEKYACSYDVLQMIGSHQAWTHVRIPLLGANAPTSILPVLLLLAPPLTGYVRY